MAQQPPGQTLQATALVHEAWLRLVRTEGHSWANRAHFFVAATEAMRRILVENARRTARLKRGGRREKPVRLYLQRLRCKLAANRGSKLRLGLRCFVRRRNQTRSREFEVHLIRLLCHLYRSDL